MVAATPGMPMIALMNRLGYDVATLGNHEFDHGQAFLGRMIDSMAFEVVCANVTSDTCTFPQLPPYVVLDKDGIRIGFVGVVTNYEGPGHPAGNASSFEGLEFPDPQAMAMKYAAELRPKVDLLVLVSHMGDDRDVELLGKETRFDVVIGGHTHVKVDSLVNGTLLTQTGKYLKNVGVTAVRFRGGKIEGIESRLVPLDGYAPDASYQAEVDRYYADPELNKPVGAFAGPADKWGLANWMAASVRHLPDGEHALTVEVDDSGGRGRCGEGVRPGAVRNRDRHDADDSGRHAPDDPLEVQRRGEPQGGAPDRPDLDDALRHRDRRRGQRPRRAFPEVARRQGVRSCGQRLCLQELQGPELHRRETHGNGGRGRAARRVAG